MTSLIGFPERVDEVSARLVASGVVLLGLAVVVLRAHWLLPLLFAGFLLRVLAGPRLSPLALVATRVVRPRLDVSPRMVPGPPKRFAQSIGAVFTGAATLLWLAGAGGAALVLVGVLVVFAALEALVGLCVGCKVFAGLMRAGVIPQHVCERCVW